VLRPSHFVSRKGAKSKVRKDLNGHLYKIHNYVIVNMLRVLYNIFFFASLPFATLREIKRAGEFFFLALFSNGGFGVK